MGGSFAKHLVKRPFLQRTIINFVQRGFLGTLRNELTRFI